MSSPSATQIQRQLEQAPFGFGVYQTQLLGLASVVGPSRLAQRTVRPIGWVQLMFPENVKPENFCHHNSGMTGFVTSMDSNIIHEFNVINFIDFYIKSQRIYFSISGLIKQTSLHSAITIRYIKFFHDPPCLYLFTR